MAHIYSYCAIADDTRPVRIGATYAETKKKLEFFARTTEDSGAARKTGTYNSDVNCLVMLTAEADFSENASKVKRIDPISFGNGEASLSDLT